MKTRLSALGAALLLVVSVFSQIVAVANPASAAPAYRVLITGDSITQGSSGDYTWRYRLWNKLASTAPGNVDFVGTRTDLYDNVNDSFGSQHYAASFAAKSHSAEWGTTFVKQMPKIASQVAASDANTLVVMTGGNDLMFVTSPADTIMNLRTYIANARAARPGLDVVVGEAINRWDPWAQQYPLTTVGNDYAALLRTMASELSTSSERVVIAPTRTGWDSKIHTYDGTHPNPTGEAVIAQRVSEGLAQIGIGTTSPSITGNYAWNVTAPAVTLTPGSEQAQLSWSRTSTGATGFYIETRLVNTNAAWQRLPYPIGGNGWTSTGLAAGGTYQYRIVPAKIWSTGLAGPASSTTVSGPVPGPLSSVSVTAGGDSSWGGKTANASWPVSTNAQGYLLSSRMMSSGTLVWNNLPYPVSTRTWQFGALPPGRRHQFRIQPVRGFLSAPWKSSSTVRMKGLPGERVYVALGDSYSAGLGANSTDAGGGYWDSCYRTSDAWAFQMQSIFNSYTSLKACSGAKILDVYGQVNSMATTFNNSPGAPQLVTVTIGGNDVGFADKLKHCVLGACADEEGEMNNKVDGLTSPLRQLYASIQNGSDYADIVAGGYPWVVEVDGQSGNLACKGIGNDERSMINRLVTRLNSVISGAASDVGVWSVGQTVRSKFVGHNACVGGMQEWIHAADGDLGYSMGIGPNSFHPNPGGQFGYALAFSDAILSLSE